MQATCLSPGLEPPVSMWKGLEWPVDGYPTIAELGV